MRLHHRQARLGMPAFTLVELLVIIAIIVSLAALLFPVFGQARAKARAAVSISNLRQIGTALLLYSCDYDEAVIKLYGSKPYESADTWVGLSMPYVRS